MCFLIRAETVFAGYPSAVCRQSRMYGAGRVWHHSADALPAKDRCTLPFLRAPWDDKGELTT